MKGIQNCPAKFSTQVPALLIPPAAAGGSFNPGLQDTGNALESHRRQPVDRSIPARAPNKGKQRLGLNDPPAAAGGILGIFRALSRLGLNNPPAAAGGILVNITCVETLAGQFALQFPAAPFASDRNRPISKKRPNEETRDGESCLVPVSDLHSLRRVRSELKSASGPDFE